MQAGRRREPSVRYSSWLILSEIWQVEIKKQPRLGFLSTSRRGGGWARLHPPHAFAPLPALPHPLVRAHLRIPTLLFPSNLESFLFFTSLLLSQGAFQRNKSETQQDRVGGMTPSSVFVPAPGDGAVDTMETGASEGSDSLASLGPELLGDTIQHPPLDRPIFGEGSFLGFRVLWLSCF